MANQVEPSRRSWKRSAISVVLLTMSMVGGVLWWHDHLARDAGRLEGESAGPSQPAEAESSDRDLPTWTSISEAAQQLLEADADEHESAEAGRSQASNPPAGRVEEIIAAMASRASRRPRGAAVNRSNAGSKGTSREEFAPAAAPTTLDSHLTNDAASIEAAPSAASDATSQYLEPAAANVEASFDQPLPTDVPGASLWSVYGALHSPNKQQKDAAVNDLRQMGMKDLEIDIAWQATHPVVAVRAELAERLPGMAGIDAKPWLLALSRDSSAQVRRIVITWMATSGEPELMRRVEEAARKDPDSSVRQQAERAMKRTGPSSFR